VWPVGEEVCRSFWNRERDENPMRMRSLFWGEGRRRASSEREVRRVERADRLGEGAQKQVTRRISCLAVASTGSIEEVKMDSPLPVVRGLA
jgi:hypothetical protein